MSAFTTQNENGIAVITFDLPGEPVNKLTAAVRVEIEALLIRLRDDASTRAVVLISGKPDSFIAGADIEEFTALTSQDAAERLSFEGQETVSRVETSHKPIVAAIHGACLGGGLEFALACHYRIATDHPKTQLGLPEVQLGLIPGAGGCQRLPRLIGVRAALDMILTGKSERAGKALRLGLVDELVPPSILRRVAVLAADRLAREGLPQRTPKGGVPGLLLDRTGLGRRLVYRGARKQVLKRTGGHYPAPLAILDCVEQGFPQNFDSAIRTEMDIFAKLIQRREPRNMIRTLFLGRLDHERLKKNGMNPKVTEAVAAVSRVLAIHSERGKELSRSLARAGFHVDEAQKPVFDGRISGAAYWFDDEPKTGGKELLRARLAEAEAVAAGWRSQLDEAERRAADYLLVTKEGVPAYLGGLFAAGLG